MWSLFWAGGGWYTLCRERTWRGSMGTRGELLNITWYDTTSHHMIRFHITSHDTIPHHITWYDTTWHHMIRYHIASHDIIQWQCSTWYHSVTVQHVISLVSLSLLVIKYCQGSRMWYKAMWLPWAARNVERYRELRAGGRRGVELYRGITCCE